MPPINPYGAPQARVGDFQPGNRPVLEQARSVPADHALAWYREAWRLFKLSPGVWIGIWIVFLVILMAISIVPLIGSLVMAVVTPVFAGGIMIAARNASQNNGARFGDLFAAFSGRAGQLMVIGLIQLAVSVVFFLVFAAVVGFGGAFAMMSGSMSSDALGAGAISTIVLVGLLSIVVFVPLTNAVWLGSALTALEGTPAVDAQKRGFGATLRNIVPLIVFLLITFVLAILASIPLGLGWIVLSPVLMCAVYAQFQDLFAAA
jgi:uncharacterized membrane protein